LKYGRARNCCRCGTHACSSITPSAPRRSPMAEWSAPSPEPDQARRSIAGTLGPFGGRLPHTRPAENRTLS
jgi:hypothetical protein